MRFVPCALIVFLTFEGVPMVVDRELGVGDQEARDRQGGGIRPATWSRWRHYGGLWRWFGDERLWGATRVMVIGSERKGGGRFSDDGEEGVDDGVDLGGGSRRIRVPEVPLAPRVQQDSRSKNSSPMGSKRPRLCSKRHSRITDSGGDGE
ncbi:hypothetical protein Hanom_Chr05g00443821 [Helianthus anomalus]